MATYLILDTFSIWFIAKSNNYSTSSYAFCHDQIIGHDVNIWPGD